jgi:glycosyltransferase involved in cell wall biosynthesis
MALHRVKRLIRSGIDEADAYIIRASGSVGAMVARYLERAQFQYGIEVVSDPLDFWAPRSSKTILRPLLRHKMTSDLGRQCRYARAVSYTTEWTLQKRYPTEGMSTNYSSIDLPDDDILNESVAYKRYKRVEEKRDKHLPFQLCFIGSLSPQVKAPDILIRATSDVIKSGMHLNLVIIGEGDNLSLRELPSKLSIGESVQFRGRIPAGSPVYEELDQADLFVLPSRSEGLPRAMIEAMARGVPCIGSTVGGIPELLSAENMVAPNDVRSLSKKIQSVLSNPNRLLEMSLRNLKTAQKYVRSKLVKRRRAFYEEVKRICLAST